MLLRLPRRTSPGNVAVTEKRTIAATIFGQRWLLSSLILSVCMASAMADEFFLVDGTKLEGRLLNPDELPRELYKIRVGGKNEVIVQADQVSRHVPESQSKRRYLELLPRMPATADGNWRMAKWCRDNALPAERDFHLEQTIRLDPQHEKAHRELGHNLVRGKWVARDEVMLARGYVRHKGRWRLPQEVAIDEQRTAQVAADKQWRSQFRTWRRLLDRPDRQNEAWSKIQSIKDPVAAGAIAEQLAKEPNLRLRRLYVNLLADLDTGVGNQALAKSAIADVDDEIRRLCVERMPASGRPGAATTFSMALKSENNLIVRRAGAALMILQDSEFIPQLIDALVTKHKIQTAAGSSGQLGASFGGASDGSAGLGSMSFGGGGPKFEQAIRENREVLDALLAVAPGVDFGYDQGAWRAWLVRTQTPQSFDLRRVD